MNIVSEKMKEVLYSILPITVIVLLLNFTLTPLDTPVLMRFLVGTLFIVVGLSIFLFGIDLGITPLGNHMGHFITKSNKIWVVIILGIILGFFINAAEPDLHILAGQVETVTQGLISKFSIVLIVSAGIAVMLSAGLVRIISNFPLYKILTIIYVVIFVLALFTSREFLAISFDASGATTGALTVPFVLALAYGVSALKRDSKASEKDSFGLVGITSTGAILSVMIMSIFSKSDQISGELTSAATASDSVFAPFISQLPHLLFEVFIALLPLIVIFMIFQFFSFKLTSKAFIKILKGFLYTFIGLILFLTGVNAGFMDVGTILGQKIVKLDHMSYLVIIGFILGLTTILAEPAVYVLTHQIETVTSGYVKRSTVLIALSIGVGAAVALSMIRIIIPEVQLWHYLLPGYLISIILSFLSPKLFVGIAFDSGGVASGPMTATFVLAFAQGAAEGLEGADVLIDGFGIIAMVALTPLIALQVLGIIYKMKSKKGIDNSEG